MSEDSLGDLLMNSFFSFLQLLCLYSEQFCLVSLESLPSLSSQQVKLLKSTRVGVFTNHFEDAQEVLEVQELPFVCISRRLWFYVIQQLDVLLDLFLYHFHGFIPWLIANLDVVLSLWLAPRQRVVIGSYSVCGMRLCRLGQSSPGC